MTKKINRFHVSPALTQGHFNGFMLDTHHKVIHKIHEGHSCHHATQVHPENRHYYVHLLEHHRHESIRCKECFSEHSHHKHNHKYK